MKKNDHTYFQNKDCKYFPCHRTDREEFNCMFCYCPLYALGDQCGGRFQYLENGIKDCSDCSLPHGEKGYDHVMSKLAGIAELAKKNRCGGKERERN